MGQTQDPESNLTGQLSQHPSTVAYCWRATMVTPEAPIADTSPVSTEINNHNRPQSGMTGRYTITAIIPTLNEAKNLPYVLPILPEDITEVIVVDGNSTDNTVQVVRELCPHARIIMQEGRGKGNALTTGFAAATGDIIVHLDADGSTDPCEIPVFVGALLAGADFVKGSRFVQGGGTSDMPLYRKFGNGVLVNIVRLLFGGNYSDLCYGYNAFWRHHLPLLETDASGFEIETMLNIRALIAGLNVAEVPSFESDRIYGQSNLRSIRDGWRILRVIIAERLRVSSGQYQTKAPVERPRVSLRTVSQQRRLSN